MSKVAAHTANTNQLRHGYPVAEKLVVQRPEYHVFASQDEAITPLRQSIKVAYCLPGMSKETGEASL
jgi:hypothetical protein